MNLNLIAPPLPQTYQKKKWVMDARWRLLHGRHERRMDEELEQLRYLIRNAKWLLEWRPAPETVAALERITSG